MHETIRDNYANYDIWNDASVENSLIIRSFNAAFVFGLAEKKKLGRSFQRDKCKNKWLSLSLSIRARAGEINTAEMAVGSRAGARAYMSGHT